MNVTSVHEINLAHLDRARPAQPGDRVRVHLGASTWHITSADAWRIRSLVYGAAHVQLVGGTSPLRDWIATVIADTREADTR